MDHKDLFPMNFYWVVDDIDHMEYLERDFVEHQLPDIIWVG